MNRSVTALALGVCMGVCLTTTSAVAQPSVRWLAHDMQRPKPPIVTPGKLTLPVAPPSDAIVLFDGGDLSNWRDAEGGPAKWRVKEGVMESVPNSGYLYSADKFGDVQLHVEWAAPLPAHGRGQARGNSGVFLMGLYEVQVLDSYQNDTYADGQAAAIYGQYPPLVNACLPPGEWQSYDIVFRRPQFHDNGALARAGRITVFHNNILAQDNVEIWGPTAWLQNMPYTAHAHKLPIALQDHGNPVRFRNIWLRPLGEPVDTLPAVPERKLVELTAEQLQKYAGRYTTPLGEFCTIELKGTQLQVHMKTGQLIDLLPVSGNEFVLRFGAGELLFNEKPTGEVTGFTMQLGGERYPLRRAAGSSANGKKEPDQ